MLISGGTTRRSRAIKYLPQDEKELKEWRTQEFIQDCTCCIDGVLFKDYSEAAAAVASSSKGSDQRSRHQLLRAPFALILEALDLLPLRSNGEGFVLGKNHLKKVRVSVDSSSSSSSSNDEKMVTISSHEDASFTIKLDTLLSSIKVGHVLRFEEVVKESKNNNGMMKLKTFDYDESLSEEMQDKKWNCRISMIKDGKVQIDKVAEFWNMSINDERCKEDEDIKRIRHKIYSKLTI